MKSNTGITSQSDNEIAIKKTIEGETAAYTKRDSTLLISFYADDPITQSAWNNTNGTYGSCKGFDVIRTNFSKAFKNNPAPHYQPKIERSCWFFRPMGNDWMWLNFLQKMTTMDGKVYTNYETRVMNVNHQDGK